MLQNFNKCLKFFLSCGSVAVQESKAPSYVVHVLCNMFDFFSIFLKLFFYTSLLTIYKKISNEDVVYIHH